MKIKTRWDAVKFLKNFDKQLEAICSEFKCGSSCPFFINKDCIISESGPINVDGACQAILDSMEEPPRNLNRKFLFKFLRTFPKKLLL